MKQEHSDADHTMLAACQAVEARLRVELKQEIKELEQRHHLLAQQVYKDILCISNTIEELPQYQALLHNRSVHPPNAGDSGCAEENDTAHVVGKSAHASQEMPLSANIANSSRKIALAQSQFNLELPQTKRFVNEQELMEIRQMRTYSNYQLQAMEDTDMDSYAEVLTAQRQGNTEAFNAKVLTANTKVFIEDADPKQAGARETNGGDEWNKKLRTVDTFQEADVMCKDSQRTTLKTLKTGELILDLDRVALNGSAWEIAPFVGTPAFGFGGSLVVTSVLILNLAVQFIFCVVALTSLTEDDFDPASLEELEKWRSDAHSLEFVDRITAMTTVNRVCELDKSLAVSTNQVQLAEIISKYVKASGLTLGAQAGVLMCMLALMVWYLTIMKELNAMFDYVSAILYIESGSIKIRNTEQGSYDLQVLDIPRKCSCCIITFVRLIVAGFLMFVGAQSIIYTNSVSDLLLNALALELILNIDEYLFTCLAPGAAQRFMETLEPLPTRMQASFHGITLQTVASPILVMTALIVTFFVGVKPHLEDIKRAQSILCSGNQDFAYVVDAKGFAHATSNFESTVSGLPKAAMNEIVQEAIIRASLGSVGPFDSNNMLSWAYDMKTLDHVDRASTDDAEAILQHSCSDLLSQTKCSSSVLYMEASENKSVTTFLQPCPAGYMTPRSAAECRQAAIDFGKWNLSAQEQIASSAHVADVEVPDQQGQHLYHPCQKTKHDRTVWSGSSGFGLEGYCICEPMIATSFKQFATVANSVPITDCTHLDGMGACVFENPPGSRDNSTLTRFLCPKTCGCDLRPVSPFRTGNCPVSCSSQSLIFTRGCQDALVQEIAESKQMRYFLEDVQSMKLAAHSKLGDVMSLWLVGEIATRGCTLLAEWRSPYGSSLSDSQPLCRRRKEGAENLLTCLKYRCQNLLDETQCPAPQIVVPATPQQQTGTADTSSETTTTAEPQQQPGGQQPGGQQGGQQPVGAGTSTETCTTTASATSAETPATTASLTSTLEPQQQPGGQQPGGQQGGQQPGVGGRRLTPEGAPPPTYTYQSAEWCNTEIEVDGQRDLRGKFCPKSCGWCIETEGCDDVTSENALYDPTGGYGLAHFWRGFCPTQCGCAPTNDRAGCPAECVVQGIERLWPR